METMLTRCRFRKLVLFGLIGSSPGRSRREVVALALLAFSLCVGCRTAPVANFSNQQLNLPLHMELSAVREAVGRVAKDLGWLVEDVGRGEVYLTRSRGRHVAVISLRFLEGRLDAEHFDSQGLSHSGSRIHRTYNAWVEELVDTIKVEVARGGTGTQP